MLNDKSTITKYFTQKSNSKPQNQVKIPALIKTSPIKTSKSS